LRPNLTLESTTFVVTYATGYQQHDLNAAKAIYVTDLIDVLKAAHGYSSRKFCKSFKSSSKLFKIVMKI
jgi:hypothetical protein